MRKLVGCSLSLLVVFLFAIGCGSEGPQGPAGQAADVEVQSFEEHEGCPGTGVEILVDGETAEVVCDGVDGESSEVTTEYHDDHAECPEGGVDILIDGEVTSVVCDGATPEVAVEADPDHEDCPAGGVDILVDGEPQAVVCDGADGEDGESSEVTADYNADHSDCPAGGVDISIDGTVATTICDGEDGQDGTDGDTPTVTTERDDDHDNCPAGGVDVLVDGEVEGYICDGETPDVTSTTFDSHEDCPADGTLLTFSYTDTDIDVVICNGEDGQDGGDGETSTEIPDIETERFDDHDDCDAGGTTITFSFDSADDVTTYICDGVDGEDGEDGDAPDITVEEIYPGGDHSCELAGGYRLTVQIDDSDPATFEVCADYEPVEACTTTTPDSPYSRDLFDAPSEFAATFEIVGVTDDDTVDLPEDFIAEVGIGNYSEDRDPTTDWAWEWYEASVDGDFNDDFAERVVAELGEDELDAGEYFYLFRMSVDDGTYWFTCGIDGMVEISDYDSDVDAGYMEVISPFTTFLHWDFEADDEEDRLLNPPVGDGWARFSDGDFNDPVGGSEFFGGGSDWAAAGYWVEASEFPPQDYSAIAVDNFDELDFFEFNSNEFSDYDTIEVEARFQRTSTGPSQVQLVGEFDDGTLAMLPDALDLPDGTSTHTIDMSPDVLVAIEGGTLDADDELESVRVYGFDSDNYGGSENMRIEDIEFNGM